MQQQQKQQQKHSRSSSSMDVSFINFILRFHSSRSTPDTVAWLVHMHCTLPRIGQRMGPITTLHRRCRYLKVHVHVFIWSVGLKSFFGVLRVLLSRLLLYESPRSVRHRMPDSYDARIPHEISHRADGTGRPWVAPCTWQSWKLERTGQGRPVALAAHAAVGAALSFCCSAALMQHLQAGRCAGVVGHSWPREVGEEAVDGQMGRKKKYFRHFSSLTLGYLDAVTLNAATLMLLPSMLLPSCCYFHAVTSMLLLPCCYFHAVTSMLLPPLCDVCIELCTHCGTLCIFQAG